MSTYSENRHYERVLISPQPDLLPDVEGQNRYCRWKERSVHVPNCKSFLVTEAERKHVRRRARFQQRRDASCHQVFFFPARQGNSRLYRVSLSSTTQRTRSVARVLRKAASVLNLRSIRGSSFQEITIIIVSVCYQICNTSSVISECNQKCELYNSVITCTQWRCQASYCVVTLTIN